MDDLISFVLPIVKSIALAIVTLVAGLLVIKWIVGSLRKALEKSKFDNTLKPFLLSVASVSLKVLLVISIVKILGVDTTSFVAIIAAAGFAIGLAFQGSLANFARGILLLTQKTVRTGDYIEATGYAGTVQAIWQTEGQVPANTQTEGQVPCLPCVCPRVCSGNVFAE